MAAPQALSRLSAVARALGGTSKDTLLLVLPDLSPVHFIEDRNVILVNHLPVVRLQQSPDQNFQRLVHTGYAEPPDSVPAYPLITLHSPLNHDDDVDKVEGTIVTIENFWSSIYALHHIFHAQEVVPVSLAASIQNRDALVIYALQTGLATRPKKNTFVISDSSSSNLPSNAVDVLLFCRGTFWQGAGTTSYHGRGFLQSQARSHLPPTSTTPAAVAVANLGSTNAETQSSSASQLHCGYPPYPPYPYAPGFTRTPLSITAHPVRPPKPAPGEVIYRRWCRDVGMMLEMQAVDFGQESSTGSINRGATGEKPAPTPHLLAYNRWHNNPHVARAWHHEGSVEFHRQYLQRMYDDDPWLSGGPSSGLGVSSQSREENEKEEANSGGGTIGLVMCWDGEPMGWTEVTWLKVRSVSLHETAPLADGWL